MMNSKSFIKQNIPNLVGVDAEFVDISIQFGLWRDLLTLTSYELSQISLHSFKLKTCELLSLRYPEHDIKDIFACTLFFVHYPDDTLEPLRNPAMLKEDVIIDVLLGVAYQPSTSQHEFRVHSYKKTTFCDYCGCMLAGLTKQGMKCSACGINLHKKCVYDSTPFCYKLRQTHQDASNIIATTHSHMAQSRSTTGRSTHSASGHYKNSNVMVPHTFVFHKFIAPTQCNLCGRTIKGIFKQGMQCKDCDLCCHRKCMKKAINSCPGEITIKGSRIGRHSMVLKYPDGRGHKWSDGLSGEVELPSTDDADSVHSEPASPAKNLSNYNLDKNISSLELRRIANDVDKYDRPHRSRKESDRIDPLPADEGINPNIPLQRIFVSVNPKDIGPQTNILKEGWMVNCNENDYQRVRCYLRLDRRSLCMFSNSDIPTPFKQIFLADMLAVDQVAIVNMNKFTPSHCFEVVTKEITYYLGMEVPGNGKARNKMMKTLQRNNPVYQWLQEALEMNTEELQDYGLGLDIAISWENALHHSLMPVTPHGSNSNINELGLDAGQNATDLDIAIGGVMPELKRPVSNRFSLSDDDEVIRYVDEDTSSSTRISMRNRPRSIKSRKGSTRGSFRVPKPDDVVTNLVIDKSVETNMDISLFYQIYGGEVLGSGQFGTVHEGVHRATGESVAIKVIDKQRFQPKHTEALKNEANILQSVSHNGIIKLYKMFESPTRIFVIMEKMQWDMLEMILNSESGRLSEGVTKFVIYQILTAIQFLHSKNIVHCDLKPENVLLSSKFAEYPQIKLCDFGFAKTIRDSHFRKSVVGTPAYLAPEVLTKTGYDKSLDMWSLGVVIYVSLSGTFPFNEDESIIDQINNADFMYPPYPWKTIDIEARHMINKFLRINKRERLTANKALLQPWLKDRDLWEKLREVEGQVGGRYLTHPSEDEYWSSLPKGRGVSESSYTQASEDSSETSEDCITQAGLMDIPMSGSKGHPDSGYSQSAGYSSDGSILDGSKHKKNTGSAFDPIENTKMLKVTTV